MRQKPTTVKWQLCVDSAYCMLISMEINQTKTLRTTEQMNE